MSKKVLVLGATGAMGRYLVPCLAEMGYQVDGVSVEDKVSDLPNVNYIKANAKDKTVLASLLKNGYDGIVDFMWYPTGELPFAVPRFLDHTEHYIFLSSCRVYDDLEHPVKETSPRLLDSTKDVLLRNSDDYSIYKARGENILNGLPKKNWTIVRPATTYSFMRYQLVTLEAANTVGRAMAGKAVVVPEQARKVQATMSWGGDVAQMIARLLFREEALRETYSVTTSEHHSWEEIADYYKDICNLKAVWVDKEDYLGILFRSMPAANKLTIRWQLEYARLFERVMDNSKILAATGMKQEDLMPLYDGLKLEISRCPENHAWPVNKAMDEYLASMQ